MPKSDPGLTLIAAKLRAGGGRSSLYRWLRSRHATFAALLEEHRPDWPTLATGFHELGIARPDGSPLAPATVRHVWWRVRRDLAKRRPSPSPAVTVIRPAPATPTKTLEPTPPADDALAGLRRQLDQRSGRS